MPVMFNTLLRGAGLSLGDVCLLRHQDNRADRGRTPYKLWRDDRPAFELYQSHQKRARKKNSDGGIGHRLLVHQITIRCLLESMLLNVEGSWSTTRPSPTGTVWTKPAAATSTISP
jgi:hypothetical protein